MCCAYATSQVSQCGTTARLLATRRRSCATAICAKSCTSSVPDVADAGLGVNTVNQEGPRVCYFWTVGPTMVRLCKLIIKNQDKFSKRVVAFYASIYWTSRVISSRRTIVENVFGYVRRWKVMAHTYRHRAGKWCGRKFAYAFEQAAVADICMWMAKFCMINEKMLRDEHHKPLEMPDGASFGYPAQLSNSKSMEHAVAVIWYDKKPRGKASIKKAREMVEKRLSKHKAGNALIDADWTYIDNQVAQASKKAKCAKTASKKKRKKATPAKTRKRKELEPQESSSSGIMSASDSTGYMSDCMDAEEDDDSEALDDYVQRLSKTKGQQADARAARASRRGCR